MKFKIKGIKNYCKLNQRVEISRFELTFKNKFKKKHKQLKSL